MGQCEGGAVEGWCVVKRLEETKVGDRVVFFFQGLPESGTVKRVKPNGMRCVEPDSLEVNEWCWVDVRPAGG